MDSPAEEEPLLVTIGARRTLAGGSEDTPRLKASFTDENGATFFADNVVPDTRATRTLVDYALLERNGIQVERQENVTIRDAQKKLMPYKGTVRLVVLVEGAQPVFTEALAVRGLSDKVEGAEGTRVPVGSLSIPRASGRKTEEMG